MEDLSLAYEREREERIAANRKQMEEMGIFKHSSALDSFCTAKQTAVRKPPIRKDHARRSKVTQQPRRSGRISGCQACFVEIDEHDRLVGVLAREKCSYLVAPEDELIDLMDRKTYVNERNQMVAPPEPSAEALEAIQEVRCGNQGRGSVYDSTAGITCHFCRQKKLCGEEGCPRCSTRDTSKECIGKTSCARCMGATGKFCRACLVIRYGQTLEEAHAEMEAGTWLCPHCYEEEHPEEGWICNSSICMKRRGLKPTGIAIYDAQNRGFKSVAHLLQDQLKKTGGSVAKAVRAAVNSADTQVVSPPVDAPAAMVLPAEEDQDIRSRVARRRADGKRKATIGSQAADKVATSQAEQATQVPTAQPVQGGEQQAAVHVTRRSSRRL